MNINQLNEDISTWAKKYGLRTICLTDKAISFHLDAYSCYKQKAGTCSLDFDEDKAEKISVNESRETFYRKVMFCRDLFKAMQRSDNFHSIFLAAGDEPYLEKMSCGHYHCNGQHRICVAKHKGILFPFQPQSLKENKYKNCSYCMREDGWWLLPPEGNKAIFTKLC